MQHAARSLIEEVESELAKASPDRRLEMLRKVTDLCVVTASNASDEALGTFDHVITWMAQDMEFRARLELSERLSTLTRAPQRILGNLAEDENIEIAKPILENSRALAEEVLVRIAERGEENRLIAIAGRTDVSERLTDIIVVKGGEDSVQKVAQNRGARFSHFGFERLVTRAGESEKLQAILSRRGDLPVEIVTRLTEQAKARATMALKKDLAPEKIEAAEAAVESIAGEIIRNQSALALDEFDEQVKIEVDQLAAEGKLNDLSIAAFLRAGNINHALMGMGVLTRLPFQTVKQSFHAAVTDPLLFIVKAIPLSLETYHLLLTAKVGYRPGDDYLAKETQSFRTLSVSTAQRIARFMAVRGVTHAQTS